jgi:nitroreductase
MDIIYKRRSIRKYKNQKVSKETIENIIKAGMNAPSAGNEQPWQFIVINERKLLDEIMKVHPYSKMLAQVDNAILVCGDLTLEKHEGFWMQDCSAATENMLLETETLGLGSVWLGIYPREDRTTGIQKLFNLPDTIIPFSLLPIGYKDEDKALKNEFHIERIHYNKWQ